MAEPKNELVSSARFSIDLFLAFIESARNLDVVRLVFSFSSRTESE